MNSAGYGQMQLVATGRILLTADCRISILIRIWRSDMGQIGRSWTFYKGKWHEGDVRILGASSQATWLGSLVFDGARGFEGVIPDLDRHCARVNRSAEAL